jgi:predicted metal-binding membrane protein
LFGVMNLVAMLGLAVVVLLEKVWRHGAAVAWVVGAAALAVAVAVVFVPELAPALTMKEM